MDIRRSKRLFVALVASVSVAVGLAAFVGCVPRPDIVLGFAGSFSGQDYKLGVDGRNAADLFVKQLNDRGGIRSRKVRLETRDFSSDPAKVVPADRELLAAGAVAIVGHFTSASANAALDFANENRITLVSPTATADNLGGKDDFFFRSIMTSGRDPMALAYDMGRNGRKSLVILATAMNRSYVDTYVVPLASLVSVTDLILFDSPTGIDWARVARAGGDAVLVIAGPADSGTIAQELAIRKLARPLYLSGFAATGGQELVQAGGKAVEGAWIVHQIDESAPSLATFASDYAAVYGTRPSAAAIETWDAMCLVKTVLEAGGTDRASFHSVIRSLRSFQGAEGRIELDENGDARRTLFVRTVRNGEMVVVGRFD